MSTITEQQPEELQQPDLSQHRLDIVRDCADLAGRFPENVKLEFVLWEHGDVGESHSHEEFMRLAKAVQGADAVASELAFAGEPETPGISAKDEVEREYELLNKKVRDSLTPDEYEEFWDLYSTESRDALGICTELANLGTSQSEMPYFFPVDTYAEPTEYDSDSLTRNALSDPSDRNLFAFAAPMRHREATVLRQLQAFAKTMSEDGEEHTIAVMLGSYHSFVAVAARTLGAKVSRTFLASPVDGIDNVVMREYRLAGPQTDNPDSDYVTEAIKDEIKESLDAGERTDTVYLGVRGYGYPLEKYDEDRVAALSLLMSRGKGTANQRRVWDNFHGQAQAFAQKGKLRQYIDKKSMEKLLQEYESMLKQHSVHHKQF